MPVANVKSGWVDGNLVFYDKDGNIIITYDGTNRKLTIPSGATLEALGTNTIADASFSAADIALTTGSILLGTANKAAALDAKGDGEILIGNGTTAAMKAITGDVTLANTGVTAIGAKKVVDTMISATPGTVLVGTKTDLDVTLLDNSAAGSLVIGQGAGETCAAHTLSGDVTMDATGAVTIAPRAVESGMLANGAGVAALLTAGLGGSVSVARTDAATTTVVEANATKDRACLVLVVVDETYAIGTGTLPTVKIGEDDTIEKCMAGTILDTKAAGTVLAFAFTNTATKKIIVTTTAAVGDATGGCSITVLAIPTT